MSCPYSRVPAHAATASDDEVGSRWEVDLDEARAWLEMFYAEQQARPTAFESRWAEIKAEVALTGSYTQTVDELEWGARVAWRQSVRCIGRGRWKSLVVRDARAARTVDEVARELTEHLRFATNDGRIRSTITVFRADGPNGPRALVANDQLIRYAGYRQPDGSIVGDPRYAGFTAMLREMGWTPPTRPSRFDVLPWLIATGDEEPRIVEVPPAVVLDVAITHPTLPWFAELGLRWHAVPVISNMRLRIGGVNYSCAPFNGFYLVDEIATRNFGDADRYNQLQIVGRRMGLDTDSDGNFWKVRAAVELNTAVLHSFRAAGVRIAEPIAESELMADFARREELAGRHAHGDWSWINGHLGSSFGPSWHRYYDTDEPNPNFWLDPDRAQLSSGRGGALAIMEPPDARTWAGKVELSTRHRLGVVPD
jgi:nitric-oxide synthase